MPTTKKPITFPQAIDSAGKSVGIGLGKVGDGGKSIGNGLDYVAKAADSAVKRVDSFAKNLNEIFRKGVVIIGIGMFGYMLPNCYNATLNYVQKKELQEQKVLYQNLQSDYQRLQSENLRLHQQVDYHHTLEGKIQN